jgi:hypothetical protein
VPAASTAAPIASATAPVASTAPPAAPTPSKEELALQQRVSKLEEELKKTPDAPADVLRAGDFPGSIHLPGSNMAAKVGGFVRLGFVDSLQPIASDDRFIVGSIPVEEGDEGRQGTTISAKRSRVNLDMRMDSSVGQFRAFIEGDFAGEGGTENYRLRHAYGQYKSFLIGQTWTTFEDLDSEPEDVDFEGLNSSILLRHPQIRWVKQMKNQRILKLSMEDPETSVPDAESASTFPDTIATIKRKRGWGHTQFGVVIRQLSAVPIGADLSDESTTFGWGLAFSGDHEKIRQTGSSDFPAQLRQGYRPLHQRPRDDWGSGCGLQPGNGRPRGVARLRRLPRLPTLVAEPGKSLAPQSP